MGPGTFVIGCTAEGEPIAAEVYRIPGRAIGFWVDELAEMARMPRLDAPSAAALRAVMRESAPPARDA